MATTAIVVAIIAIIAVIIYDIVLSEWPHGFIGCLGFSTRLVVLDFPQTSSIAFDLMHLSYVFSHVKEKPCGLRVAGRPRGERLASNTANLRAKILDFGGSDPSRTSILRGGILMSAGDLPETLSSRRGGLDSLQTIRQSGASAGSDAGKVGVNVRLSPTHKQTNKQTNKQQNEETEHHAPRGRPEGDP